jgi:hypothetical protein
MACARAGVHDGRPPHRASYRLQVSISMTAAAGHRAAGLLALTFRHGTLGRQRSRQQRAIWSVVYRVSPAPSHSPPSRFCLPRRLAG